ncbi:MAG: DUF3006 domain-containing protein [Defluviitaleaceae bacterium]|nr:DUF3006 domain-containing protein [Defluviitaleaceae bacterium]
MEYIIDRIEDGIAVIESKTTGEIIELPKKALPRGAREGQMLIKEGDSFIIDKAGTEKRRAEMRARLDKILGKK